MLFLDPDNDVPKPSTIKTLRDYQNECLAAIRREFAGGVASTVAVLPTGMGKTVVLSRLASEWPHGNVLIVAHRIELLEQAADKLASELGFRPPIEQGQRGLTDEGMWSGGNIVIGSVATLRNLKRMEKYRRYPFGLVIVDECHHAIAASYRRVMESCVEFQPGCKFLGVTATPNRTDNAALGIVFQTSAYALNLRSAIECGWLVPINQEYIHLDEDAVDFSNLTLTRNKFGEADFPKEQLEAILTEENALHAMSKPILDKTEGGQKALIFNAGVAHAHMMAAVLNRYKPGSAAAVDGKTDAIKRAEIVRDFSSGSLQYLLNFGVFTEGYDAPEVQFVVMARPTKSLSLYMQMLGRGTRPLPGVVDGFTGAAQRRASIAASGKPFMTCLDFVGNSRHKPASVIDALGGEYDVDVRALADKEIRAKGGDVQKALDDAKVDMALMIDEKKRKAIIAASVAYDSTKVDVFGNEAAPVASKSDVTRGGSTDQQIGILVSLGVQYETAAFYGRRQASAVIDNLGKTRCTAKQRNVLKKYGYDCNIGMKEASKIIDRIAANGWKRPEE